MDSLAVALVLTAVNNLTPGINSAISKVKEFDSTVKKVSQGQGGFFDDNRVKESLENLEELKKKSKEMQSSGTIQLTKGFAEARAVQYVVGYAAEFEEVMKKVEIANYDASIPLELQKEQLKELSDLALKLGKDTIFSNTDAAKAQLTLIKNGMEYKDVLEGGAKASMYLAQTAEVSTNAAADAVSQVTNMFQLQGSQLMQTADEINRAANASSAGVINIMSDLQQTGQTAHNLGLNVKETTLLLGTLHNMGLGDSSGTFLNDLLLRLDAISPEARKALYNLGLLKGAKVETTKSGKTKIIGGESSLFNEQGQLKSAQDLVNSLRQTLYDNQIDPKMLFDRSGNMVSNEDLENIFGAKKANEVLNQMKKAFGIQGMRASIALTVSGKGSYEEMIQKAERMKNIEEQVIEMQGTLVGVFEELKGSWETLMTSSGSPIMQELKDSAKGIKEMINKTMEWVNANPKAVATILKLVGYLAMFNIATGAGKLLFGNFLGIFSGGMSSILKFGNGMKNTLSFFTAFKGSAKIGELIGQSFAFGFPKVASFFSFLMGGIGSIGKGALTIITSAGKVGASFLSAGAKALIAGGRMAAAWLIGLGPVGWIIAGATAIIIGGIAAWKTNFLGFRDKVLEVWDKIKGVFENVKQLFGINTKIDVERPAAMAREFSNLGKDEVPMIRNNKDTSSYTDNRQITYNIQSTDPRLAAKEVSKNNNDKYYKSRDPKLQE